MNVERKYNDKYYQIHIDLSRVNDSIKIFSKNGKNSIIDRIRFHRALRENLKFDIADCRIKKLYILERKLLIWTNNDEKIESFHKIRKYMKRSDRLIGTARDSSVNLNEHLIIIFFNILLLDDIVCIKNFYDKRRQLLQFLIYCIFGQVDIGIREIIDFSFYNTPKLFNKALARVIARRWEGMMLKNYDNLYFLFHRTKLFIKLKKDYIADFRNIINFAIIGGRRDARDEQEFGIRKL
jgi:DNA ligase 4